MDFGNQFGEFLQVVADLVIKVRDFIGMVDVGDEPNIDWWGLKPDRVGSGLTCRYLLFDMLAAHICKFSLPLYRVEYLSGTEVPL